MKPSLNFCRSTIRENSSAGFTYVGPGEEESVVGYSNTVLGLNDAVPAALDDSVVVKKSKPVGDNVNSDKFLSEQASRTKADTYLAKKSL